MAEVTLNKITGDIVESYTSKDLSLIPAFDSVSQFNPKTDRVELSIYDEQGLLRHFNPQYTNYRVILNYNNVTNSVSTVTVDPEKDLKREGYDQGNYTVYYNFLRDEISSSLESPFFITQISSDRTEVRIVSNNLTNEELQEGVLAFLNDLNDSPYFEDFRLDLGNNIISIANNILLDTTNTQQYSILVKLYEALPEQIEIKDSLTVSLQTADEVSYSIRFEPKVFPKPQPKKIGAPNFNINIADKSNNDTIYKSSNDILNISLSSSYDEIQALLNNKGIKVNIDYSDFNNFVYFSSAEERVRNFYYKVGLIEGYESEISTLDSLTNTNISSSTTLLEQQIRQIKENFDGYERYQYYSSGSSNIYPKTNSTPTYTLAGTGSADALSWLNTQILSASNYDNESVDRLVSSLPEYVQSDERNASYLLFMDMVGQHFDNIWVYIKDISNRYDGDNRLDRGISKDAVRDALTSMGINVYQNNISDLDLTSALTTVNSEGGTGIISGSGEINTTTIDIADPEPKEDAVKGVYKRIFHNLPFLLKKKGSVEGLRALINTFGIPEAILRISEFGGEKGEAEFWEYYQNISNYGVTNGYFRSALTLSSDFGGDVPDSIIFRMKWISGSLPINNSNYNTIATFGGTMDISYTGDRESSGSYDGSIPSSSWSIYSGEIDIGNGEPITAPIFNGEWWTFAILNKNTVVVGSSTNHGGDGFRRVWKVAGATGASVVSGNNFYLVPTDGKWAAQEVRFYNRNISNEELDNLIMNPFAVGDGREESYDGLAFRAPLGSDLNTTSATTSPSYVSIHPRTGSTAPDFNYDSFSDGSTYSYFGFTPTFIENNEFAYYKEPVVGIKNRVSRKIKNITQDIVGTTLSNLSSIQQKALNEDKLTPDVNYLEVGFSPQNEINDDIAVTYGNNFDLGSYIGDPSKFEVAGETSYLALNKEAESYFQKYSAPYDWKDFVRLIKYFDSSLFKMIKDFTPARSSLASGIIIKQHLLERNKHNPALVSITSHSYEATVPTIGQIEGGGGGVFNAVNSLNYYWSGSQFDSLGNLITGSKPYPPGPMVPTSFVSQSWQETLITKVGNLKETRDTQEEFYNGELKGTQIVVTDGNLLDSKLRESLIDYGFSDNWEGAMSANRFILGATQAAGNFQVSFGQAEDYKVVEVAFNSNNGTTDYANQLSTLLVGNGITIQTIGTYNSLLSFVVNSISTVEGGTGTTYRLGLTQQSQLSGAWYLGCQALVADPTDPLKTWDGVSGVTITFDPGSYISRTTEENSRPLYNNVSDVRKSSVFMDIDYSSSPQGNGILTPVNLDQIIEGIAVKAPVQDSNYSSTSWTNGRYKGTKVSSVGFNIQGFKE